MKKAMKDFGLKGPYFEITENWFTIIFERTNTSELEEKSSLK